MAKASLKPFRKANLPKNIGLAILAVLLILSIIGLYGQPLSDQEEVSLSRVVEELEQENIVSIAVEQEELIVTLKNNESNLVTRKESGSSVTETFRNLGVTEEKLRQISFNVTKPSGVGFWASAILPILLPFLLLGGFLWFMMRSAQVASHRAMSFGQMQQLPVEPGQ